MLNEHPLATNRLQHLENDGTQQLLRWNRRTPCIGIQLLLTFLASAHRTRPQNVLTRIFASPDSLGEGLSATCWFFGRNAVAWGRGFTTGVKPTQEVNDFTARLQEWHAQQFGSGEYTRIGREAYQTYHDWRWRAGTVGYVPVPAVMRQNIRNLVPPPDLFELATVQMTRWRELVFFKR